MKFGSEGMEELIMLSKVFPKFLTCGELIHVYSKGLEEISVFCFEFQLQNHWL